MSYIAPPALDRGDKIAVVSLASRLDAKRYYAGKEVLQKQTGFEIIEGKNIFAEHYNFAGTDEQRIRDFQEFLDDPSIKAIIAGRGGYGISRIVDRFSWDGFMKNPKWVVGFSDVTLLHQKLQTLGFQSIHGPMMVTLPNEAQSTESLINSLTGEKINYRERSHILNRTGNAHGEHRLLYRLLMG
jgi:muramoyltetrapeptide carboxypeptidase